MLCGGFDDGLSVGGQRTPYTPRVHPEPSLQIGPYRLVEQIGEGGMGVVWKARDTTLDRDVAIKFLPAAFARDPDRLARFEREAKAVAALAHPAILAIFGFGEQGGSAYAVTELLEGQTLREAMGAGPIAPRRAAEIAKAVADGLSAAHDRGIIHRDLKPENIFLTKDGRTKVLDFGLASFALAAGPAGEPSTASLTPTRTSLTTPGTVLGTTDYLSPEQVRGVAADTRSDIFSFGAVLYEMLSGRRPFRRDTAAETMTAILREDPPALAAAVPGVPAALDRVVTRCLAKRPEDRFPSAREIVVALDGAADEAPRKGRPRLIAAVVFAVVVIAAIAAWKGRALLGGTTVQPASQGASLSSIGEPPSAVPEANEYFEKGLFFMRAQLDIPRARQMFDRAIELDPSFGSARAMLALLSIIAIHEGYSNDGALLYRSESDARNVLAKQPDLPSAHGALGAALLYLNRKEQAQQELETALRLDAQSQAGSGWLALADRLGGRFDEAEARARKILVAVPLFWAARMILSDALFEAGHIDEAHREIEKVFEQDPKNLWALRAMARVHLYQGDTAGARTMLEGISAATHPNFRVRILWALLLAREGKGEQAVAALDPEVLKYAGIGMFVPPLVAEIYALAGKTDEALDWLDRGVRNGDERSAWFRRDEFLASIRSQPRFQLIMDAIDRGRR